MTYEGTAHGNPPYKHPGPSYEDVVDDGCRIVTWFILGLFAFGLVIYMILTVGLDHGRQQYKPPTTVQCEGLCADQ